MVWLVSLDHAHSNHWNLFKVSRRKRLFITTNHHDSYKNTSYTSRLVSQTKTDVRPHKNRSHKKNQFVLLQDGKQRLARIGREGEKKLTKWKKRASLIRAPKNIRSFFDSRDEQIKFFSGWSIFHEFPLIIRVFLFFRIHITAERVLLFSRKYLFIPIIYRHLVYSYCLHFLLITWIIIRFKGSMENSFEQNTFQFT